MAANAADAGTFAGIIASGDGASISGAIVVMRGKNTERTAITDSRGHFEIAGLPAGLYAIRVSSAGYDTLSNRTIGVQDGETTTTALSLVRTATSLITIGRVQVSAGSSLSTSSAPSTTIDAQTYAGEGFTRLSDVLQNDISTSLVHPVGGGSSGLPTSVALRGPDPTETLVDIDGHQVNNGNTGDFDLSLLDPADYGSVELVKGISPSSLVGPDTIDGAINIRTLEPTTNPHGLARVYGGSFGSFGETLESTGTIDRLGYALSLHRTTSNGEVNQTVLDASNDDAPAHVGSAFDGSTLLGKLRYAFGSRGDGYAELSFHDQSQYRDLSAALSTIANGVDAGDDAIARRSARDDDTAPPSGLPIVDGFEGTALSAHNAAYGLDLRLPLGGVDASGISHTSLLLRHYTSLVSQSIDGPGADTSPYLYNDRDRIDDETFEIEHTFAHAMLTLQYDVRNEQLATDFLPGVVNDEAILRSAPHTLALRTLDDDDAPPAPDVAALGLGQTQRAAVLRYTYEPAASLHLTAAGYYSRYSLFGSSLDPRFGAVYTPDSRTVVRFSAGTTYQSPQLPELFVPSPLPVVVGNYVSVGNPHLQPDRATEYEVGLDHLFELGSRRTDVSVDFYRVNLRNPASVLQPALDPSCGPASAGGDGTACPLSYPVNAGDGVYTGIELQGEREIANATSLRAGFAVRSAYLTRVPAAIQDGTLVPGEQSLGLPLQKATLSIVHSPQLGFTAYGRLVYEGLYNELDQPQYATIDGGLGYRWRGLDLLVSATNLTNTYDRHFTIPGGGLSYGGVGQVIGTDAYALQGTAINVAVTHRF